MTTYRVRSIAPTANLVHYILFLHRIWIRLVGMGLKSKGIMRPLLTNDET